MRMKQRWAAVGILALGMGMQSVGAAVIYTENFANSTGSDAALDTVGWLGGYGVTGTNYDSVNPSNQNPNVNAAVGSGSTNGFLRYATGTLSTGAPSIVFTNEIQASATAVNELSMATFFMRNGGTTADVRFALQVESVWYVTTAVYNTPTTTWLQQTVDFSSATWNLLNYTSGSTLAMGSAATLPLSGQVNGIGFFTANKPGFYMSFDDVAVSTAAIPEPATVALFAIAGLVAGCQFVRRTLA